MKKAEKTIRKLSYVLICVVLLSVAANLWLMYRYQGAQNEITSLRQGAELKTWSIGDVIETPEFSFTVHDVKVDTVGIPKYLPVPEGQKYVAVDVSLKNKTEDDNTFVPLNTAYLRDADNHKYDLSLAPTVEFTAAGRVASGDTIRGEIGYLVPAEAKELRFYVEPFANKSAMIVIDISSKL